MVVWPAERLGVFPPHLVKVDAPPLHQEAAGGHARGIARVRLARSYGIAGPAAVELPGDDGVILGPVVDGDYPGDNPLGHHGAGEDAAPLVIDFSHVAVGDAPGGGVFGVAPDGMRSEE